MRSASALWLPAALAGCGSMAIDGQVVDGRGKPASGAMVSILGTRCTAIADADGTFAIPCDPGDYTIVITQAGYTTREVALQALESKRYDLGKQVLTQIPAEKGLFIYTSDAYAPLNPGRLKRQLAEGPEGTTRSYCLDRENSEVNTVSAGELTLFDNDAVGWRPFTLDAEGCAYRDIRGPTSQWKVVYKDKPESHEEEVGRSMRVSRITVVPGDYFIADWDKGFFTPAEDEKFTYVGSWVHVDG